MERVKQALVKVSNGRGHLQGSRLVERLQKAAALDREQVIKGLASLVQTGSIQCADWHRGEPIGRVFLNIEVELSANEKALISAMKSMSATDNDIESLLPIAHSLDGWSAKDLCLLVSGLEQLRNDFQTLVGTSRYIVSARYLLGSSKLLDSLPSNALKSYGIDKTLLAGAPSYVVVAGPPDPISVVLVENPQSLEAAVNAGCSERIAWVATYGYGLSRSKKEAGQQFAGLLTQGEHLRPLVRSGCPPPITELLLNPTIRFWGDLDLEGLKIYKRLKSWIPQLELSALYCPMVEMIKSQPANHPYHRLTGKESQVSWNSNDSVLQDLIGLCGTRAVDQESVDVRDIKKHASEAYVSNI